MRAKRSRRAAGSRLAAACMLVLGLTACDGAGIDFGSVDFGSLFSGFEEPAPPAVATTYYDITNTPFLNSARFKSSESDEASMVGSDVIAEIAANIANVLTTAKKVTVRLEGHADMRCGEAIWRARHGRANPNNATGTWCSPRDAYGVTPQGIDIGWKRADTVQTVVVKKLRQSHRTVDITAIEWSVAGLGEYGHIVPTAAGCTNTPAEPRKQDSANCLHDRRVDVFLTSVTESCVGPCEGCVGPCGFEPPCEQTGTCPCTDPAGCCVGADCEPPPPPPPPTPTCLELGNCPNDPKPTLDPVRGSATAFSYAQQNTDQSIRFTLGGLTCDGGEAAPCGDPTSGEMRTGTAGPYLVSSRLSSFVLNAPSGYRSPAQYRIITDPTGASLGSGATAKLRFYAVTRAGAPYSYTATAAVTVQWNTWEWDGSSKTITGSSTETVPVTLTCTPAKTPTCSFGVLGSNVSR